jgi:hypothetical protein
VNYRLGLFLTAGVVCLSIWPAKSSAVVIGTDPGQSTPNNQTQPIGFNGWNYVGTASGASCVYLGNDWCISAYHVVGAPTANSSVSFNGFGYLTTGQSIRLTNPSDSSATDLVLFKINAVPTGLSTPLTIATSAPVANAAYTNAGYGLDRNSVQQLYDASFNATSNMSDAVYEGYNVTSYGANSWGTNSVYNFGTMSSPITTQYLNNGFGYVTLFSGEFLPATDQILSGDSGGGAFNSSGQLMGINLYLGAYAGQPDTTEALYGQASYMADLSVYAAQINADIAVPEPTSAVLFGAVGLPLLLRRRRAAAGA